MEADATAAELADVDSPLSSPTSVAGLGVLRRRSLFLDKEQSPVGGDGFLPACLFCSPAADGICNRAASALDFRRRMGIAIAAKCVFGPLVCAFGRGDKSLFRVAVPRVWRPSAAQAVILQRLASHAGGHLAPMTSRPRKSLDAHWANTAPNP